MKPKIPKEVWAVMMENVLHEGSISSPQQIGNDVHRAMLREGYDVTLAVVQPKVRFYLQYFRRGAKEFKGIALFEKVGTGYKLATRKVNS